MTIFLDPQVKALQDRFVFLRGGFPSEPWLAFEIRIPVETKPQKFKVAVLAGVKATETFQGGLLGCDFQVEFLQPGGQHSGRRALRDDTETPPQSRPRSESTWLCPGAVA